MHYKLPSGLNDFQRELYIHLIEWKWKYISRETGIYRKKDKNGIVKEYEKDAILPEAVRDSYPLIFPAVLDDLKAHKVLFDFKLHDHFHHMASSQAANINLFLPILLHSNVNSILRKLKPDFKRLATEMLYKGFRIEYWDGNSIMERGLLGDHSKDAGTDSDIAIAYYNNHNELCLWLIEHKLTEKEFTTCGGYRTRFNNHKESCNNSFTTILAKKELCHYHRVNKYQYWNLTDANKDLFIHAEAETHCPFRDGMNQLWRNQLLGLGLMQQGKYKHVVFSVVKHPDNHALDTVLNDYQKLTNKDPRFSWFSSSKIIQAAENVNNKTLEGWAGWYRKLYMIKL